MLTATSFLTPKLDMAVIRLVTICVVFGSITLLLLQNLSPSLPLTFLGMRSQPLPLAVWVLLSILAGAATSLAVSALFRVNLGMPEKPARSSSVGNRQTSRPNRSWKPSTTNQRREAIKSPVGNYGDKGNGNLDDWDLTGSEDWDFEDEQVNYGRPPVRNQQKDDRDFPRDKRIEDELTEEDWQEDEDLFIPDEQPKAQPKQNSDSTYSYSYHQPQQTGVGKTESVYDADYRVLVPPYYPESSDKEVQPPENQDGDDDWDFLDDLDVEEGKNPQVKEKKNPEANL